MEMEEYSRPWKEEEGRVRDLDSLKMTTCQLQRHRGVQARHQEGIHLLYLQHKDKHYHHPLSEN